MSSSASSQARSLPAISRRTASPRSSGGRTVAATARASASTARTTPAACRRATAWPSASLQHLGSGHHLADAVPPSGFEPRDEEIRGHGVQLDPAALGPQQAISPAVAPCAPSVCSDPALSVRAAAAALPRPAAPSRRTRRAAGRGPPRWAPPCTGTAACRRRACRRSRSRAVEVMRARICTPSHDSRSTRARAAVTLMPLVDMTAQSNRSGMRACASAARSPPSR